jgi:hypothetical protein
MSSFIGISIGFHNNHHMHYLFWRQRIWTREAQLALCKKLALPFLMNKVFRASGSGVDGI